VQYVGDWSASREAVEEAIKASQAKMIYSTLGAERVAEIQALLETAAEELGGEEVVSDYEIETAPVEEAVPAETGDDLTMIKGLGPKTAAVLTAAGITTYAQLASTSEPDLRHIFAEAHTAVPQNVNTWAMQAAFAKNGDWPGLNAFNQKIKDEAAAKAQPPAAPAEPDDLTQLAGIGPKVAKALNAAGYDTYEKLANTNEPQLRAAIHQADMLAPTSLPTWPMQATYAAKGDWQGLFKYNQKLSPGKAATSKAKTAAAEAPPAKPDDLTQIRGIGPRMASILAAGNVTTYAQLQQMSAEQLREIVSAGGALPPSSLATWPTQAAYAAKGDWRGLADYNKKQK
jgi:predicted flap endonuclease-1-like 5' DNA nuclease